MTPQQPSYRTIELSQGQVAIVDASDYAWLNQWKWCAALNPTNRSYYATRQTCTHSLLRRVYMHRLILGLEYGDPREGDHIDAAQTLDNRRCNLRIATRLQNARNRRTALNNTSGFKGVVWHKTRRTWNASVMAGGTRYHLGCFVTPEEAYAAYCEAAQKLHGEFARTE